MNKGNFTFCSVTLIATMNNGYNQGRPTLVITTE